MWKVEKLEKSKSPKSGKAEKLKRSKSQKATGDAATSTCLVILTANGDVRLSRQLLVVLVCTYGVHLILNTKPEKASFRSVAILVLGDMGRSPRMMYHAESWAKSGFETYLVGYRGMCCLLSIRLCWRMNDVDTVLQDRRSSHHS